MSSTPSIGSRTAILGSIILPDRILGDGVLLLQSDRIEVVGRRGEVDTRGAALIEHMGYVSPGFVDLHVHGGAGADFMDATPDAFASALSAHLRHGTTSIVPTTTVASHSRVLSMLDRCRQVMADPSGQVLGAHLYGPYFGKQAAGCHPSAHLRDPVPEEYLRYLESEVIISATVAPELPGAEAFARACAERGVLVTVGHSHATFDQMRQAVDWGVRHVDHLFCAMSDKAKLRQTQTYPMRGGVLEATLFFDELTTEVIADGKHLDRDLLLLAYKIKGPDRLALVTDCSRALDMPDGSYLFGPIEEGEPFVREDDVGIMPDGSALASSVQGMDHMVRTFRRLTGVPLHEVIRMASLTPARILGHDSRIGSLEPGKRADVLLLDESLTIQQVWIDGQVLVNPSGA